MKESDIIAAICEYLKSVEDCFFWKEHGGMYGVAGIPDIICCYKGRFAAFEVKADNRKATLLQEITIRKIRTAGGTAEVVRSVGEVKAIIQKLR
jgi:hypothetical protein